MRRIYPGRGEHNKQYICAYGMANSIHSVESFDVGEKCSCDLNFIIDHSYVSFDRITIVICYVSFGKSSPFRLNQVIYEHDWMEVGPSLRSKNL